MIVETGLNKIYLDLPSRGKRYHQYEMCYTPLQDGIYCCPACYKCLGLVAFLRCDSSSNGYFDNYVCKNCGEAYSFNMTHKKYPISPSS